MKKFGIMDFLVIGGAVLAYYLIYKHSQSKPPASATSEKVSNAAGGRPNRGLPAWAGGISEWGTPPTQFNWDRDEEWRGGDLN